MSTRADIIRKAYQCIDEVYPESSTQDITSFGIDTFLDQAAKLVIKVVPVRTLGGGQDIRDLPGVRLCFLKDGVGCIQLPDNFIRLVSFSVRDWEHTVTEALDESSPRYIQQYNSTLRGTPCRPAVFLTQGGTRLEFYSTNLDQFSITGDLEAQCIAFDSVDDKYPSKLADITAWKTAELVLSAMNDVQAAQLCQAKTQEILQTL